MTALELLISPINDTNTKFPTITKPDTQLITTATTTLKTFHQPASSLATPPNSPHVFTACSNVPLQQAMSLTPADSTSNIKNVDEPTTHTIAYVNSDESQIQNIEQLKARINRNNDILRRNLETSYKRLRLIQTKSFQTHVAQQLNSILELKHKQKLESTTTVTPTAAPPIVPDASNCVSDDVIDATSVDLLTSILKSNLSNSEPSSTTTTTAVKSLLDDIQYEILKQADDIKIKSHSTDSATDDDNDLTDVEDQNTTLADLTADTECSVDWNKDPEKALIDSSNVFWAKNRAHLGSEWTRVQTKMKQLKFKFKHCNEYLVKQSVFEQDKNNNKNSSENNNTNPDCQQQQHHQPSPTSPKEKEAIAALSTSLQESVAAEVFATQEEPTVSRCMPYKRSNTSRLFNLSRSDLIELDDEVLKSFYYTLRYFGNTYFKTMCLCGSGERSRATKVKRNSYYYQKKQQKRLEGSGRSDLGLIYSASETLKKTCIFCHLLKKYEQTRMENSAGVVAANQKDRKLIEVEKKRQLLEQHQQQQQLQQQQHQQDNLKMKNQEEDINTTLADPIIVNRDHSYCKQVSLLKKPSLFEDPTDSLSDYSSSGCGSKKSRLSSTCANEELIDKLVGDRLSRIFDGHIKNEKLDVCNSLIDETVGACEEEVIDAGLDLTPDDLQKLPDFSYEELKFLNEIELDKSSAYRKKFKFVDDTIDMSCENTGYSRDYASFIANKAYPLSYQMSSEIFNALNYRPKYRSLLNKKRREQKRSDQLQFSQFSRLNEEITKKSNADRKTRTVSKQNRNEKHEDCDDKKDSSWQPGKTTSKTPSNTSVRPRKRQRSTSSYSSNSSILSSSNNDSNYSDTSPAQKSSSSSYYSPSQSNQTSKFDIDNILMPFDMIASAARPVVIKHVNVPTPMWRENPLETLINITDEIEENLDDSYFIELHELCEKKKLDVARGKKLKATKNSKSENIPLPGNLTSECLNKSSNGNKISPAPVLESEAHNKLNNSLNSKCRSTSSLANKWMPREFPLSDQDYESLSKQQHLQQDEQKNDDVFVANTEEIINK